MTPEDILQAAYILILLLIASALLVGVVITLIDILRDFRDRRMEDRYTTEFINDLGQKRYQPTLPDGDRLWQHVVDPNERNWIPGRLDNSAEKHHYLTRSLYRSERRAHRRAVQEIHTRGKGNWKETV